MTLEKEKSPIYDYCFSARIILVGNEGYFPLVQYKDTDWFGLPGGKEEKNELPDEVNRLSAVCLPVFSREFQEECGIDISGHLNEIGCLGLASVNAVDEERRQITQIHSAIFVSFAPELKFEGINNRTRLFHLDEHIPGPLFPDARLGLAELNRVRKEKKSIAPVWLNKKNIYFKHRSNFGLLMGPPAWAC